MTKPKPDSNAGGGNPIPHPVPKAELTLLELAERRVPDWIDPERKLPEEQRGLTSPERDLIDCVERGRIFIAPGYDERTNDPANAATWGPERVIRATVIVGFCKDPKTRKLIPDFGIQVRGARIEGELELRFADYGRPLALLGCAIMEGLDFRRARLKELFLHGTHTGRITADGMKVEGGVHLCQGFKASRGVKLTGAVIGGDLDCKDGEFRINDGVALSADGIEVKGEVSLISGFKAFGGVRMLGAAIGGDLACVGGEFYNEGGYALKADGMKVQGSVLLRKRCVFEGRIGLATAVVEGHFQFYGVNEREKAILDLRGARIRTLWIGEDDRPEKDRCYLHGLMYDSIAGAMPWRPDWWIELIERQTAATPDSEKHAAAAQALERLGEHQVAKQRRVKAANSRLFLPQPYEQAAKVLREQGHDESAKAVLIAKEKRRTSTIQPSRAWGSKEDKKAEQDLPAGERLKRLATRCWLFMTLGTRWGWHWGHGLLLGYGYRPVRAFWVAVVWVFMGASLFALADHKKAMIPLQHWALKDPSKPLVQDNLKPEYPSFQPFIYSAETFTPLIKLRQADYWHADPRTWLGCGVRWFVWLHTAFGWVLTTLLVAALTGVLRR